MADEKDPRPDLSQRSDDEAPTQPAQDAEAQTSNPPEEVDSDAATDPETRMVERLTALRGDDASEQPTQVLSAGAPEAAAQPNDPETPAEPQPESPTERTSVLPPVPVSSGGSGDGGSARQGSTANPGMPPPKKKRRWPWIVLVVIVLLGAGYVATAFATQDALPATLTVEGVDVSGLSVEEAAPVLEQEFAARTEREITVSVEADESVDATIVPSAAGYSYDVDATLDGLTELTFDPRALWSRIFGEAHVDAVQSVDEQVSEEAVAGLAEQLTFDPTEGSAAFIEAAVDYTEPVHGFTVDREAMAEELHEQWLSEATELTAPGDVTDPVVSAEQWEQFLADTAEPLVEGAYTVTAGSATAELSPTQLANAAEVRVEAAPVEETDDSADTASEPADDEAQTDETPQEDRPVLHLDGDMLTASLAENNTEFASTNEDASIRLAGSAGSGQPEVVPGSTGRGVDGEEVVDKILTDLTGERTRAITVELHEVEPSVTTEEVESWDVTHVVAEFATPYPASDGPRTANLRVGAERINGTVVMPGEEFNLNALLAPITAANGYHSSGVVESGVTTNALGGGLSQIATMSYNAGFLGGMEVVEHKPHSRWFDRYPQGRESTYWEGQINVRWKNDTDAPVIVEMWLSSSQVHTRLWGSDYFDVSTSTSEPYNFTASPTIRNSASDCISERGGRQGFTVDVHRSKTPPNGQAIEETWRWAYSGWPTVICE